MRKVTVIVPLYNSELWVSALYLSIAANAKSSEWNVTIEFFDDGSSDSTWKIVSELPTLDNVQVISHRWLSEDKMGSSSRSYAKAICEVSMESDLYILSDHDDVWLPNKLERITKALKDKDLQPWLYAGTSLNWNSRSEVDQLFVRSNPGPRGRSHVINDKLDARKTIFEVAVSTHNIAFNKNALKILRSRKLTDIDIRLGVELDNYIPATICALGDSFVDLVPTILWRQHDLNSSGDFEVRSKFAWKMKRIYQALRVINSGKLEKYLCASRFARGNNGDLIFYLPKNRRDAIRIAISTKWQHWSPLMNIYLRLRLITLSQKTKIRISEKI